jgi:dTDP-4-amino-4,6-dideoxygalactose transaminase
MRTVFEARASTILFQLVSAIPAEAGLFLLPANICPVVPMALLSAGRRFEFIDLDEEHLCMSEALLLQRLAAAEEAPVAGIIFVHTYGFEMQVEALFRQLKALVPHLLIVDDRCLCVPVSDNDMHDLQGADVLLFSTGYSKQVDLGFGGLAYLAEGTAYATLFRECSEDDLERLTVLYKQHIREQTPIYRATDPEAVGALQALRWLDTAPPKTTWREHMSSLRIAQDRIKDHREKINTIYKRWIPPPVRLPDGYHGWRFQIRLADSEALLEKIFAAGFFASDHYFPAAILFGGQACPVATRVQRTVINLFNDFHVEAADAEAIGEIVARHLKGGEL